MKITVDVDLDWEDVADAFSKLGSDDKASALIEIVQKSYPTDLERLASSIRYMYGDHTIVVVKDFLNNLLLGISKDD